MICRHCGREIQKSYYSQYPYWHVPNNKFYCRNNGANEIEDGIEAEPHYEAEIVTKVLTKYL
jgi:hypothetical protein